MKAYKKNQKKLSYDSLMDTQSVNPDLEVTNGRLKEVAKNVYSKQKRIFSIASSDEW